MNIYIYKEITNHQIILLPLKTTSQFKLNFSSQTMNLSCYLIFRLHFYLFFFFFYKAVLLKKKRTFSNSAYLD